MEFPNFDFTEDQQAIEDEGIIIPIKQNVPMNNPYNRNQNNFFQPPNQPPQAFARALPMYSTTVTNSPVSMMNYFNAPTTQQLVSAEHENPYQVHQQKLQNLPIDLVSTEKFCVNMLYKKYLRRIYLKPDCQN